MLAVYEALQPIGRFLFAATFGNVHGAYKPGAVKLKPTILRDGQKVVTDKHGPAAEMDLVFHGGSGSDLADIRETLDYGVVKMNIDTDTQYAFTRPIVTHICQNIEGVLKIDGEVGDKKLYDPRAYLKKAEIGLANRLKVACDDLRSTGRRSAAPSDAISRRPGRPLGVRGVPPSLFFILHLQMPSLPCPHKNPPQEHPLANILINVIIPVLILSFLSKDPALQEKLGKIARPWHIGPLKAMLLALRPAPRLRRLAFPQNPQGQFLLRARTGLRAAFRRPDHLSVESRTAP